MKENINLYFLSDNSWSGKPFTPNESVINNKHEFPFFYRHSHTDTKIRTSSFNQMQHKLAVYNNTKDGLLNITLSVNRLNREFS